MRKALRKAGERPPALVAIPFASPAVLTLYVAAGGALGAVARFGLSTLVRRWMGGAFPWGTLSVNVLGSFLLGLTLTYLSARASSPELRALVTVGILGAFTTFSTFSHETVLLAQSGEWGRAGGYMVASVALGVMALFAGLRTAQAFIGGAAT